MAQVGRDPFAARLPVQIVGGFANDLFQRYASRLGAGGIAHGDVELTVRLPFRQVNGIAGVFENQLQQELGTRHFARDVAQLDDGAGNLADFVLAAGQGNGGVQLAARHALQGIGNELERPGDARAEQRGNAQNHPKEDDCDPGAGDQRRPLHGEPLVENMEGPREHGFAERHDGCHLGHVFGGEIRRGHAVGFPRQAPAHYLRAERPSGAEIALGNRRKGGLKHGIAAEFRPGQIDLPQKPVNMPVQMLVEGVLIAVEGPAAARAAVKTEPTCPA